MSLFQSFEKHYLSVRKQRFFVSLSLLVVWLWSTNSLAQGISEEAINQKYEAVKLELLCKSTEFILRRYESNAQGAAPETYCADLSSIEQSIPQDFQSARNFFKLLAPKTYLSYGKNKLNQRINKLIADIQTELDKLYQDPTWKNDLQVFMLSLKEIKDEMLSETPQTPNTAIQEPAATQPPTNQIIANPKHDNSMPFIYLILLVLIGCIGFLVWQNQKLKQQLEEMDAKYQEKYSRLDNRIDTMTTNKDFQSLMMKFNFLNEQLNALLQEVFTLKNRNEHKITAEELYAKRTEHLEQYAYNPTVQIYYAAYTPEAGGFRFEQFKTEPDKNHIYKVEINLEDPQKGLFTVIQRNEYHQLALQHASTMLWPACDYANEPYNDSRIITLEPGTIARNDHLWSIQKKAKIAFE